MTHPLDDARAKLGRATHHSKTLGAEIQAWITRQGKLPPFEVDFEENDTVDQLIVHITRVSDLPPKWKLIVGDAVFNYRAALDYAAWQMVAAGTEPHPKGEDQISFPIHMYKPKFQNALRFRLPGIRADHLAVVKCHQPYRLGADAATHPLQFLSDLSRHDKHRGIAIVFAKTVRYSGRIMRLVGWKQTGPMIIPSRSHPLIIKTGAELLRIPGEPTDEYPHLEMDMDFEGASQIAFENGIAVMETLSQFDGRVTTILNELWPLF